MYLIIINNNNTFCRTRSLSNATFSSLITWRSSSSKSAAVYKISWKSDDFSLRYGDISIFKMAAVRHLGIVYHHMRPPMKLPVKFHVDLILGSEDIAIWIFPHIWLEMPIQALQNRGFGGLWTYETPKMHILRKSPSFKLSTVKICWGVWPVGELTGSVMDTETDRQTHTHK